MIAIIGDVHGCLFTLQKLVGEIRKKYNNILIYSVGDLVDRGNFSSDVFEFMLNEGINFTLGNHEDMFYAYFRDPINPLAASWILNDCKKTLDSYENKNHLLQKHLDIIQELPLFFDLDECFISHAGVPKEYKQFLPLDDQDNFNLLKELIIVERHSFEGVLWTRSPLLDIGKLQVIGHTPQFKILFKESSNSLYIDTGACNGRKLSAVIIEDNQKIDAFSVETQSTDLM